MLFLSLKLCCKKHCTGIYALILPPVGKLLRGRTENRRIVLVLCRSGIEKLELEGPLYNGNRTLC
jgi:hypothetical protein